MLLVECPREDGGSRHAVGLTHRIAAGRQLIDELTEAGWGTDLRYWQQTFAEGLAAHVRDRAPARIIAATASDPEVAALQREAARFAGVDLELMRNPNFIADREGFARWEASRSTISFDDFTKVKIRVGRVLEASDHPNADKLIVLKVDLGDEQRQLVAGLKGHYSTQQLVGKNLIVVTNLAPRKMRGVESQGMLLAAVTNDQNQVVILTTDSEIAPGCAVS